IEKYVSREAFHWILKDCFTKEVLLRIARQCGLDAAMSQGEEITLDSLSKELTQEFYRNPKARELVIQYLHSVTRPEIEWVSQQSIPALLENLRQPKSAMIATGKVGKYLWAILTDERDSITAIIPIFILKVLETIRKYTDILKNLDKSPLLKKRPLPHRHPSGRSSKSVQPFQKKYVPPSELEKQLHTAQKAMQEAKELAEKHENRNKQLSEKLHDLQEECKNLLNETQALKHEKNQFIKQLKETEQHLVDLRMRESGGESQYHKLHHLERENKKLKYEQERREKEFEALPYYKREIDQLRKSIEQCKVRIHKRELTIEAKDNEIQSLKSMQEKDDIPKKAVKPLVKPSGNPRVGIFVDVQNIFYAAKERYNGKLDFHRLLDEVLQGRKLIKAYAYIVQTEDIKQEEFIGLLSSFGYEVKSRPLKTRRDGTVKGDWDLGIAIDAMMLMEQLDVLVLVSGDGDFIDLTNMLKMKNIRVEVASFMHNSSMDLIDSADYHYMLDEKFLINQT
ncbi:MAG: NYN domain-containing protein, partial [Chlamydiota bacterium]|nr:NYN domain-containing protein [Chlamydiota bacterium]